MAMDDPPMEKQGRAIHGSPVDPAATRKGNETKERIFATAIRLIGKNGYAATTIPAICLEANVSVGNFYHHFRSKSDILLAYVLDEGDRLLVYYEGLDGLPRSEALLACVDRFFGFYSLKGRNFVATFLSILLGEGASWFQPERLSIYAIIRDCFTRGAADGEFGDDVRLDGALELTNSLIWDLSCSWCVRGGPAGLAEEAVGRFSRLLGFVRD